MLLRCILTNCMFGKPITNPNQVPWIVFTHLVGFLWPKMLWFPHPKSYELHPTVWWFATIPLVRSPHRSKPAMSWPQRSVVSCLGKLNLETGPHLAHLRWTVLALSCTSSVATSSLWGSACQKRQATGLEKRNRIFCFGLKDGDRRKWRWRELLGFFSPSHDLFTPCSFLQVCRPSLPTQWNSSAIRRQLEVEIFQHMSHLKNAQTTEEKMQNGLGSEACCFISPPPTATLPPAKHNSSIRTGKLAENIIPTIRNQRRRLKCWQCRILAQMVQHIQLLGSTCSNAQSLGITNKMFEQNVSPLKCCPDHSSVSEKFNSCPEIGPLSSLIFSWLGSWQFLGRSQAFDAAVRRSFPVIRLQTAQFSMY